MLFVAIGPDGAASDVKWWRRHCPLSLAELKARLDRGEPCVRFDFEDDSLEASAREKIYDFLHEAEILGHPLAFYELEEISELPADWPSTRISKENLLNGLRSSEIIDYQIRHHDSGGDPERYADELAELRRKRWEGKK